MVIEALESVVNQSLPAAKILVLDDGSTDHTAAKVERWIGSRPCSPIRLYRLDRGGAASARNVGLKLGGKRLTLLPF
jgi:glycosyltransferase involved in cell wall biosynthesis